MKKNARQNNTLKNLHLWVYMYSVTGIKRNVLSNSLCQIHGINGFPANTRHCFDVVLTSFERYGRQMDVETTLCASSDY